MGTRWYNKKECYTQQQAAERLQKRKVEVDKEKYVLGDRGDADASRFVTCDQPAPLLYWSDNEPKSAFWFPSAMHAPMIQQKLISTIEGEKMKGKVWRAPEEGEDEEE